MRGGIIIVCDPKNLHYRSCWTTMKLYRWIWKGYIPRTEIFRLLYDPPDPNFSSGGMQNRWTFEFYTAYFIWSPQNNYHSTGYRRLHKLPPFAWFMVKKWIRYCFSNSMKKPQETSPKQHQNTDRDADVDDCIDSEPYRHRSVDKEVIKKQLVGMNRCNICIWK